MGLCPAPSISLAPLRTTIFLPSSAAESPVALDRKTSENHRKQTLILGAILFDFLGFGFLTSELHKTFQMWPNSTSETPII